MKSRYEMRALMNARVVVPFTIFDKYMNLRKLFSKLEGVWRGYVISRIERLDIAPSFRICRVCIRIYSWN